ncbi:MAG: peptide-methionine (S)-S-oxide reductase MsrA [Thermodesulfobacteriota bacterium]|nr:peptide-methionine (S)-S-oxide reductase MsrA [Thermodesulfobacteriota bacterium]
MTRHVWGVDGSVMDRLYGRKGLSLLYWWESHMNIYHRFTTSIMGVIFLTAMNAGYAEPASGDAASKKGKFEKATFAGGCFWCMEPPFDQLRGVISTTVGYAGGQEENPTYEDVASGRTGHAEAIQIVYDPSVMTYEALLDVFWRNIDPTQVDGQFVDRGRQYRTAIFYHNEEQKRLALASKEQLEHSGVYEEKIVTEIVPATRFYEAEEYHQDYYNKNPLRYKYYRYGSGRDKFLKKIWDEKDGSP